MTSFATIAHMIRDAEKYADDKADDRVRATQYYQGEVPDMLPDPGRSSAVSRDVRQQIKQALPSVMRTLFGSDEVVEFQPVNQGDEAGAEQASDYLNHVILPEVGMRKVAYDAIHDAFLHRNGIIRWWWDERQAVKFSRHSGLTEDEVIALAAEDGADVVEQSQRIERIEMGGQVMPLPVFDLTLKRVYTERCVKVAAVPRDRFLIDPEALSIETSVLTGEKSETTRSELIQMGYDRALIESLPLADEDEFEEDVRRDSVDDADAESVANQRIDYYEVFVRVDLDGDGISELRHMCFAGGLNERNVLVNEECDEVQFADLTAIPQPHQWEGASLADDLMDVQKIKTALLRQTLDNIYWQNNPQPLVDLSGIANPEAIMEPKFGQPIMMQEGRRPQEVYTFTPIPFVAPQSFQMLEYLDEEARARTGISEASAGLAPDALQNMTAKASAMIEQGGIGQTEMMVRNLAEGLRKVYRGILRLIVRHQDKARVVRLRDEWVSFDPRHWNADMDCAVNVGLGAGTRERDVQLMQIVMGVQEKLLAAFGPDNPFVKPENLYAALARMVEAAGLKTPAMFFTEPDPQEIAARMQAAQQQPSPEQIKAQAEAQKMHLEAQRAQMDMQLRQQEMQMRAQEAAHRRDMDRVQLALKQEEMRQGALIRAQDFALRMQEVGIKTDEQRMKERQQQIDAIQTAAEIELEATQQRPVGIGD